jgi:hypothetical protein
VELLLLLLLCVCVCVCVCVLDAAAEGHSHKAQASWDKGCAWTRWPAVQALVSAPRTSACEARAHTFKFWLSHWIPCPVILGIPCATRLIDNPSYIISSQVIADTALFGPLHVAGYFTHMALCEGGGPEEVMRKLRRDFWPTFSAELTVWPVVQAANFKLVPVQFQLLVVNLFTILDSCFMSFARANDGWFERLFPDLAARLGVEAPPAAAAAAAAAAADVSVAGGGSTKEKKES